MEYLKCNVIYNVSTWHENLVVYATRCRRRVGRAEKQRDRRCRFAGSLQTVCKGRPGKSKRAAYLDWAQEDRNSEGIHLVLLEFVTGQSVISAVSAP